MELSQSSLAMLMIGAVPIGALLSVAYRLTQFIKTPSNVWQKIAINVKDFAFAVFAGLLTVILVYYVNDGDYRYLAPLGAVIGFLISDLLFAKLIIRIREYVLRTLGRVISVPIRWIWRLTVEPLMEKASFTSMVRSTDLRIKAMMRNASNGFENFTEAKE